MRPALQTPLRVVDRGHSPERLKELASDHFGSSEDQFFFLIGGLSGSQTKFANEIEDKLGIPESALRYLDRYTHKDLAKVLDVATNPNCIGVITFGLEKADCDALRKKLDEKGVGVIKDDPDGDSYAIFSTSRRMKPNELVGHLRKLLVLFFDKDHLK